MRFLIVIAALAFSPAYASQGVVLLPNETISFPIVNQAPYSSVNSSRLELRIHGWTQPADIANIVNIPGLQLRLAGPAYGCTVIVTDWIDSFAPGVGNSLCANLSGVNDIVIRVQRDTVANAVSAQIWNANGTGLLQTLSLPFLAAPGQQLPAQGLVGDAETHGVLDYVRWFSSTVPTTANPFIFSTGDLADFEFEGTLADASPQNLILTANAPLSYSAAPSYAPVASQGAQRVLNAGLPATLDASGSAALNGSPNLSYLWTQLSGPSPVQWSSNSSVNPTITGLVFGSYKIQLTVTDSSGQSSSNTLKYGSVFTNSQDVVIPPQGYITAILGPMLRLGANPWPYFDTSQQAMADYFGGLQSTAYQPVWNVAQPGTINVTNGSTLVTGSGTSFLATFCGGGNAGVNGATIVVGYPVPGSPGQWGRAPYTVAACQSDTSLTLTQPYENSASSGNLSFASMNNISISTWINGSSNANYYDNVMAFYSLYYRSGLDDYLNYARNLADAWYTMPWFDQGRAALNGNTTLFPRLQSLTGLVLRALDGQPGYWSGIEQYLNFDYTFANTAPVNGVALNDIREQGYATAFLALGALYDPTPANQAFYAAELGTVISNVWAPALQPAGNWMNSSNGFATWNGAAGTVNVTKGSNIVNGVGTLWQQAWFNGNSFWTANTDGVTNGDAIGYTATVISPTQLALNIPYQGPTNTGRGWESNGLVGVGTQPFMLGVVGEGFRYAYLATGDARLPGFLNAIQNWTSTQGYRPDARGLWYGRMFPNCEPIAIANVACSGGNVEQSRFLSGELVGALSAAYLLSGNSTQAAFADNLYGAMFGGPSGGPDADSAYVTDISPGGWAMQNNLAKDFGFFFGFGGGASWPAARLGPSALPPPVGCSYSLGQNGASIGSAGGSGTISVIASAPSCSWTTTTSSPSVAITAGAVNTGNGSASYLVAPNTGPGNLVETIAVADQTFTITQASATCTFSFTPSSVSFPSSGGSGTINLIASQNSCAWTAVSSAPWIAITSGTSGNGTGTISYSVAPNNTPGIQSGTITVGGQVLTITQSGLLCNFSLSSTSAYMGSPGGNGTVSITASGGSCQWTASSNASFITITAGLSGVGSGTVTYAVTPSTLTTTRVGTLTIAGIAFSVSQAPTGGAISNIGAPQIPGGTSLNNGVYTVTGAGADVWGTIDQFSFYRWGSTGNATITARLTSLSNASSLTKVGLMIRQSLTASSANAFVLAMPTATGFQFRSAPAATTTYVGSAPLVLPLWLRVSLSNNTATAFTSPDGKSWTQTGSPQSIPMTAPYLGLAVGSQNATQAATATFDNLTITQP